MPGIGQSRLKHIKLFLQGSFKTNYFFALWIAVFFALLNPMGGWIANFLICHVRRQGISIVGVLADGHQPTLI